MSGRKHLILLYDQLATLLANDISLPEAIAVIAEDGEASRVQKMVVSMDKQLKGGSDLTAVLQGQPVVFPQIITALVENGGTGKPLAALFSQLSEELDSGGKLKRRLLLSLLYPGVIMCVAMFLITIMLTYVIPVFSDVYSGFGMVLPAPTMLLLDTSVFFGKYWLIFLLVICSVVGLFFFKPQMILKIFTLLPVSKQLLRTMSLSVFSRFLAVTCRFDITPKEMIAYAAKSLIDPVLESHLSTIAGQTVEQGNLSAALGPSKILPPLFLQMIRVGERGSSLSESLSSLATHYQKEAERVSRRLILIVDVLAIVFVALLVSSFVFAMYMPLFKMATVVG